MMRSPFFLRLLRRSLATRREQTTVAVLAVALGSALVCASLSLAAGMRAKVSAALRAYGANILLVPAAGRGATGEERRAGSLPEDTLRRLRELSRTLPVLGYAPLLYGVAEIRSDRVVILGTWPDAVRQINPSWRAEGRWIDERGGHDEAVVGTSLAQKLGLHAGDSLLVTVGTRTRAFRIVGLLGTGGSEDEQVLVTLRAAQELTGRAGQLSLVQVSASSAEGGIERVASALEAVLPGTAARTQLRLLVAEERLLGRLALLLGLIAALVLVASALGVTAVVTTSVLQRTREIGLMKALGASRFRVGSLFVTEAGAIGLAGGALGAVAGVALADAIVRSAFAGTVPLTVRPLLTSVIVGLVVASLASLLPALRAASVEPGVVLRGN